MKIPAAWSTSHLVNCLVLFLFYITVSCHQADKADEMPQMEASVTDSLLTTMTPGEGKKYAMDEVYSQYISPELLSYLEKAHPYWSIPDHNQWYPQLFNKYKTDHSLVNYITGDFDCNGKKDHALIVDKGKTGLAAVAFLGQNDSFTTVELTELTQHDGEKIDYLLSLYKPGRYDIDDPDLRPSDPAFVKLKCNSIGIGPFKELYEGGDEVYYWEQNELRSCVIGK